MAQVETTDQYRERLKQLFETSSLYPIDTDDEVKRICDELKYKGDALNLYQYRKVSKESIYDFISCTQTLTSPDKFNDIFDSFPYYSKQYFEDSCLKVEAEELRKFINIAREREFTSEEKERLETSIAIKVVKMLSTLSQDELEEQLFKDFEAHKQNGFNKLSLYIKNLVEFYQKTLRVTCLCEQYDNPTMWGHYADSGRGFCLEYCVRPFYKFDFCLEHACFPLKESICERKGRLSLLPVIYSDKRFDCFKLIEHRYKNYTAIQFGEEPDYSQHDFLERFKISCYKAKSWQYEREWRLILECDLECPNYYSASVFYPSAIYLGPQIPKNDENLLIKLARALQTPLGIPLKIYKMKVNVNSDAYTLEAYEYSFES